MTHTFEELQRVAVALYGQAKLRNDRSALERVLAKTLFEVGERAGVTPDVLARYWENGQREREGQYGDLFPMPSLLEAISVVGRQDDEEG